MYNPYLGSRFPFDPPETPVESRGAFHPDAIQQQQDAETVKYANGIMKRHGW